MTAFECVSCASVAAMDQTNMFPKLDVYPGSPIVPCDHIRHPVCQAHADILEATYILGTKHADGSVTYAEIRAVLDPSGWAESERKRRMRNT